MFTLGFGFKIGGGLYGFLSGLNIKGIIYLRGDTSERATEVTRQVNNRTGGMKSETAEHLS
ncbi:hypothetical protein MM300_14535 [Evansella sp. LMS18]|uniref:hypothetical protein n=1 Tax=Evansella sp. LMS18 TaxID=2924033 RepID=UPI0020D15BC0|nr:hypothetical protein [Evansella sp. LMS18]UTR09115.1 hypothetical protein MM300_14535 [Evansella sp. LMS18]